VPPDAETQGTKPSNQEVEQALKVEQSADAQRSGNRGIGRRWKKGAGHVAML